MVAIMTGASNHKLFLFFFLLKEILKTIFIWVGFFMWLSKLKTYDWAPLSLSFCKFPRYTIFLSAWSCQSHKSQNIKHMNGAATGGQWVGLLFHHHQQGGVKFCRKFLLLLRETHIIHINTKMERSLKLFEVEHKNPTLFL